MIDRAAVSRDRLIAALECMTVEWDKATQYGSPLANAANENVASAKRTLEAALKENSALAAVPPAPSSNDTARWPSFDAMKDARQMVVDAHRPTDAPPSIPEREKVRAVALAICKSRTCEGAWCCQWPANGARRSQECNAKIGAYDDAAIAAIAALEGSPSVPMAMHLTDLSSGISWNGFNILGDKKSINAVKAALHSQSIEPQLRAEIRHARENMNRGSLSSGGDDVGQVE